MGLSLARAFMANAARGHRFAALRCYRPFGRSGEMKP
jgi:hypothetical protein